jgi:hypothetical protein
MTSKVQRSGVTLAIMRLEAVFMSTEIKNEDLFNRMKIKSNRKKIGRKNKEFVVT